MNADDPFNLSKFALPKEMRAVVPRRIQKRREHFVIMPWAWVEKLSGAPSRAWELALHLLYLDWKGGGKPIKLANGMLKIDGVSRYAKRRALIDLERRGLIVVRRRLRRSPIIHLLQT